MKDRREQGKNHTICEKQKEKLGEKTLSCPQVIWQTIKGRRTRNSPETFLQTHTHEYSHQQIVENLMK